MYIFRNIWVVADVNYTIHAGIDYLKKHPEWWLYSNASPMPDYQRTIVGVYLHRAMGWHN